MKFSSMECVRPSHLIEEGCYHPYGSVGYPREAGYLDYRLLCFDYSDGLSTCVLELFWAMDRTAQCCEGLGALQGFI